MSAQLASANCRQKLEALSLSLHSTADQPHTLLPPSLPLCLSALLSLPLVVRHPSTGAPGSPSSISDLKLSSCGFGSSLQKAETVIICGAKGIMDERLVKAARVGDVTTLHNLMEADPEILERASSAHFADSPLHVAALYGKADFVEQIVKQMPSLTTETNQQDMIPLHLASLKGHVETVRVLLKAKLHDGVNQCLLKDEEGWTPLHCASQKGKIEVMEELIRACPECLEQVTAKGETVVHLALKANQFEAVKMLVDSIKRNNLHIVLKAQDQRGRSACQLAAAKKQLEVLEMLKEDDEKGDEIREERHINMEEEESETKACKEEKSNEWRSQKDALLVVATLIITLTYQALASPSSTFLKEGSTRIEWGCLSPDRNKRSQGLRKRLKDCPAVLAFLFMMFNTLIFLQSIFVVFTTLRGPTIRPARLLTLLLILCYCCLLMAFYYNAVYFALPMAVVAIVLYYWLLGNVDARMIAKIWHKMMCGKASTSPT